MELRHLRYFVAVAEELHFRRAAERLHVAQPAVSEQIRKLEQELGVRLFDRTQRSVALTAAGTALLGEARQVLRRADAAKAAAVGAAQRATSRLRVGYLPDALPTTVPRALRLLSRSAPTVHVDVESGPALELLQHVRDGELDAAIVGLPAPTRGLRVTPLTEQRAVVVLPSGHPAFNEATVALDQLAPDHVVMLAREVNPAFHAAIVSMCRDAGIAPAFVEIAAPRVEDVLLAVAAGRGIALLPESVVERFTFPGVRFVRVAMAGPAFELAVVTRPDADDLATHAFVRALARARRAALASDEAADRGRAREPAAQDGEPAVLVSLAP
jgi:DNA-binding transcriptional LysR family regulator